MQRMEQFYNKLLAEIKKRDAGASVKIQVSAPWSAVVTIIDSDMRTDVYTMTQVHDEWQFIRHYNGNDGYDS